MTMKHDDFNWCLDAAKDFLRVAVRPCKPTDGPGLLELAAIALLASGELKVMEGEGADWVLASSRSCWAHLPAAASPSATGD